MNRQEVKKYGQSLANACDIVLQKSKPGRLFSSPYNSIAPAIIDCVYSLNSRYETVKKIVKRYADNFMNSNPSLKGVQVDDFLSQVDQIGFEDFALNILQSKRKILKKGSNKYRIQTCYEIAETLKEQNIQTILDFQKLKKDKADELANNLKTLEGIGEAAVNYLFMLCGDQNKCKPDVHLLKYIEEVIGFKVTEVECQDLFKEATRILSAKPEYKGLSVAGLDSKVWYYHKYQRKE